MFDIVYQWFLDLGVSETAADILVPLAIIAGILLIGWILTKILRFILRKWIVRIAKRTESVWDDILIEHRVFGRASGLLPGVLLAAAAGIIPLWQEQLRQLAYIYMLVAGLAFINTLLDSVIAIYQTYQISRERPIKGYVQVAKIIFFLLGGILLIAAFLDRSPLGILTGLGAMSAVLLLVFKDTLLGFIASIQMTMNDMVRIGDWITMEKFGADGDVIDITVTTVKVQNWDKTITTIPTYSLISDSFQNWRGMTESGGRRIKRAIYIDMTSVRFCDQPLLDHLDSIRLLKPYLDRKKEEIQVHNTELGLDPDDMVNGRHLTNLGTFRGYIIEYLRSLPQVRKEMTLMVRQLAPTPEGLPLEVYTFSAEQEWSVYESIQSDIFDHLFAILPEFGLRVFQSPTGHDLQSINISR